MKLLLLCCCLALLFIVNEGKSVPDNDFGFINGTIDKSFQCYHEFGYYVDPHHCQRYYECSHWDALHMQCPPHLYWHPILKACHWPNEAPGCYDQLDHHVYFFIPDGTYHEAQVLCDDIYLDLVAIETSEENEFLKEKAKEWGGNDLAFWTSGKRTGGGRDFTWTHETWNTAVDYTDWCDGLEGVACDPDNSAKQCLQVHTHHPSGWWDAASCNAHKVFICEARTDHGNATTTTSIPTTTSTTTTTTTPTTTTTTPILKYNNNNNQKKP